MSIRNYSLLTAFLISLTGLGAQAQTQVETTASQPSAPSLNQMNEVDSLESCRTLDDAADRLACYDGAIIRFSQARENGELVILRKEELETVQRDAFGFHLPSLPKFGKLFGGGSTEKSNELTADVIGQADKTPVPKQEKVTEISSDILKTQKIGYEQVRFFLENGQIWDQTDDKRIFVPKARNGTRPIATIKTAAMGSFRLKINDKGSAVRVKRVK
jgi:hypothetical protein